MVKRAMAVGVFAIVAMAMLAPVALAGGGCHTEAFSDAKGVKVLLVDACFTPNVIRVQPGQSVTWTNRDDMAHTVTGVANSWGTFDSLALNGTVSYKFKSSGVFPYFCLIHPGMVGAVVVGDGTSTATTTQAVVPAPPATLPRAPTAAPQPVTSTPVSQGVSNLWRILAIAVMALFAVVLAGAIARRVAARRGTVKA